MHTRAAILTPLALALTLAAGCTSPVGHRAGEQPGMRFDNVLLEADAAIESGDREEAIRLLAAAIEVRPAYVPAYAKLGELQLEGADYPGAERTYSSLVRLEPRVFDHQYFHALALHHLDRLAEAVRAYLRALAIDPRSFDAHLNLSTAYLQLAEHAQSLPYARKAVEIDPESGRAWANLGAALGAFGSRDTDLEAVRAFENAAELMDITPELLANWATALGRLGRYREMINTLERSLAIQPTAYAHERIGYARFKLREFDAAQDAFRSAIDIDPAYHPALNGLGVCLLNDYIASEKTDNAAKREAIEHLRQSLRVENNQPRIVDLLSRFG
ncbi:MAG: hypothetical protein Tsb0013_18410 [Phycisphaerales bacterium]